MNDWQPNAAYYFDNNVDADVNGVYKLVGISLAATDAYKVAYVYNDEIQNDS